MNMQSSLSLSVPARPGETRYHYKTRLTELNHPTRHTPETKLFADLLKRQARRVMADLTECPPNTIPAHLARLDDAAIVLRFLLAHHYKETAEGLPSGAQLSHPSTLADYLACLEITRKEHRAPAFVNARDEQYETINRKLDLLAGLMNVAGVTETLLKTEAE